jgi:hypothetical protein
MEEKATGKVSGGNMPNMQTVKLAQDLIKNQFGSLDDLPKDLAITIANLYYKLTVKVLEIMGVQRKYLMESEMRRIREFGSMVGKFLSGEPHILAELKSVIEKVKTSRQQDKETSSKLTDSNVELILKNLNSNRNTQGMTGTQQPR